MCMFVFISGFHHLSLYTHISLLVPKDHVSRSKKDCYYVNKNYLLRSHTTAHDNELIRSGLNSFLVFGDVYRRDEIDSKHYPIFHQCDGVRLYDKFQLFDENNLRPNANMEIFDAQRNYTPDAIKKIELDLKSCLESLVQFIFGSSLSSTFTFFL